MSLSMQDLATGLLYTALILGSCVGVILAEELWYRFKTRHARLKHQQNSRANRTKTVFPGRVKQLNHPTLKQNTRSVVHNTDKSTTDRELWDEWRRRSS